MADRKSASKWRSLASQATKAERKTQSSSLNQSRFDQKSYENFAEGKTSFSSKKWNENNSKEQLDAAELIKSRPTLQALSRLQR